MSRNQPEPVSHVNLVVLRGVLSSDPRTREMPSGATLPQLELTTRLDDGAVATVPVVVTDADAQVTSLTAGDDVVVVGRVARRFFRAGGVTQSRTEVVAERVVRANRRQAAERARKRAADLLDAAEVG